MRWHAGALARCPTRSSTGMAGGVSCLCRDGVPLLCACVRLSSRQQSLQLVLVPLR
jgi:hypothetical protein